MSEDDQIAIDLSKRALTTFPIFCFNVDTSKITKLNLCSNDISSVPNSIGTLSSLKILCMRNNKLISLSASIGKLSSLEHLDLSWNRMLASLDDSIGNLSSLKTLKLMATSLTSLPDSIGNLSSLEVLDFRINRKIDRIPKSIGRLRSLKTTFAIRSCWEESITLCRCVKKNLRCRKCERLLWKIEFRRRTCSECYWTEARLVVLASSEEESKMSWLPPEIVRTILTFL